MILKKYLNEILVCVNILLSISLLGFMIYSLYFKGNDLSVLKEEPTIANIEEESNIEEPLDDIFVEIKGAVTSPGVYKFNSKSIINDLIAAAGGFLNNAFTNNLNLSKKLQDQMVVYVYTKYEYSQLGIKSEKSMINNTCICPEVDISSCLDTGKSIIEISDKNNNSITDNSSTEEKTEEINNVNNTENNLININTASLTELTTLNGIGEAKAKSIISYREEHGSFLSIESIKEVTGISEAIYEKIKDYITV